MIFTQQLKYIILFAKCFAAVTIPHVRTNTHAYIPTYTRILLHGYVIR